MNIFVLDNNPKRCAKYYDDQHVINALSEITNLLCSVIHLKSKDDKFNQTIPYIKFDISQPCDIWVVQSSDNYKWLLTLAKELSKEYSKRYGETHKNHPTIRHISKNWVKVRRVLPKKRMTLFVNQVPDELKSKNISESYKKLYCSVNLYKGRWGRLNNIPYWYKFAK